MSVFSNAELSDNAKWINTYTERLETKLCSQFNHAMYICQSDGFRGKSADSYKNYIVHTACKYINRMVNLSQRMREVANGYEEEFLTLETSSSGIVDDDTLIVMGEQLAGRKAAFSAINERLAGLKAGCREVALSDIPADGILTVYTGMDNDIIEIMDLKMTANLKLDALLNDFYTEVDETLQEIETLFATYYSGERFAIAAVPPLPAVPWWSTEPISQLQDLQIDDPYIASPQSQGASEGGVNGLSSWKTSIYDSGYDPSRGLFGGFYSAMFEAHAFELSEAKGDGIDTTIFGAKGEIRSGQRDGKKGAYASFKGGIMESNKSVGKDAGFGMDFCTVDGYVQAEWEDSANWAFGAEVQARGVEERVGINTGGLFGEVETEQGNTIPLGLSIEVGTASVGAGASISSQSIDARTSVKVVHFELSFIPGILDVALDLAIPWPLFG